MNATGIAVIQADSNIGLGIVRCPARFTGSAMPCMPTQSRGCSWVGDCTAISGKFGALIKNLPLGY
jgi:hypothetical protein